MGRLTELEGSFGWALLAEVRPKSESSRLTASAWVERGRDGVDLPVGRLGGQVGQCFLGKVDPVAGER